MLSIHVILIRWFQTIFFVIGYQISSELPFLFPTVRPRHAYRHSGKRMRPVQIIGLQFDGNTILLECLEDKLEQKIRAINSYGEYCHPENSACNEIFSTTAKVFNSNFFLLVTTWQLWIVRQNSKCHAYMLILLAHAESSCTQPWWMSSSAQVRRTNASPGN